MNMFSNFLSYIDAEKKKKKQCEGGYFLSPFFYETLTGNVFVYVPHIWFMLNIYYLLKV